jgi:death-on-curing protein
MLFLTKEQVLHLHKWCLVAYGGLGGIRDENMLCSAIAQPMQTFGGELLYSSVADQAGAIGYSIVQNHPFVDGNKRVGAICIEAHVAQNGYTTTWSNMEYESTILAVAEGIMSRSELSLWIESKIDPDNQM